MTATEKSDLIEKYANATANLKLMLHHRDSVDSPTSAEWLKLHKLAGELEAEKARLRGILIKEKLIIKKYYE
jgi:hypothetical protein